MSNSATIVQPVILCGGSGTRLWPLSRVGYPKQFLCLIGEKSLFQQAVVRLSSLKTTGFHLQSACVVSNEEHRFLAQEQLREIGVQDAQFLLEPVGRNTAPALTLAALAALETGNDPVLVVIPSDQTIINEPAFQLAMKKAIELAVLGGIAILGITPTHAETGYGYVQIEALNEEKCEGSEVKRFVEKPDETTACQYLQEGSYFWNAGIFVLKASVWLSALRSFRPDIEVSTTAAWNERAQDGSFIRPSRELFAAIPNESVDYAVLEKCPRSEYKIDMVPLDAGWSDLGAWDAVWAVRPKDKNGNSHQGDVIAANCKDTLVHSTSRLVALVGLNNIVVIETADAILVADKTRTQEVKKIVASLSESNRAEQTLHRKVHRPWGWYDSIDEGGRFKVKRIQVKPKASLSLQKHHHRAEHWIVVTGTAEITNGEKVILLTENQSTYIPLGEVHRLVNPGSIPLEIIEVQSGSYLGEDDIVRFEDTYGRK